MFACKIFWFLTQLHELHCGDMSPNPLWFLGVLQHVCELYCSSILMRVQQLVIFFQLLRHHMCQIVLSCCYITFHITMLPNNGSPFLKNFRYKQVLKRRHCSLDELVFLIKECLNLALPSSWDFSSLAIDTLHSMISNSFGVASTRYVLQARSESQLVSMLL